MSNVSSFISAATNGLVLVRGSGVAPALPYPALSRPNRTERALSRMLEHPDLGGKVVDEREARSSLQTLVASLRVGIGGTMIEELAYEGTALEGSFAVYAEPPWLLHLSGELDLCGAPALSKMLEGPIKRGGTVGLDCADLTYMDSSGVHVILNTVGLLGERGRVVLVNPSPVVRRLVEICGLDGTIDISDHPSSPHFLD
jgi:anti-anti-sigma factor